MSNKLEKKYISQLKKKIKYKFRKPDTGFFEWHIDNFDKLTETINYGPKFKHGGFEWQFGIKNFSDTLFGMYLFNNDIENEKACNVIAEYTIAIRSSDSYEFYIAENSYPFIYFANNNRLINKRQILNKNKLFVQKKKSTIPLVNNNNVVISVFISSVNYKNDTFKDYMSFNFNNYKVYDESVKDVHHQWKITKFNELPEVSFSDKFNLLLNSWKLKLYKNKNKDYYTVKIISSNNIFSSQICADVFIAFQNCNKPGVFYEKYTNSLILMNKTLSEFGFVFDKKSLHDKSNVVNASIIENNSVTIHVFLRVTKSSYRDEVIDVLDKFIFKNQCNETLRLDYKGYTEVYLGPWFNFNNLTKYTYEIDIFNSKWEVELYPKGSLKNPYKVSIYLKNKNDEYHHYYIDYVIALFRKFKIKRKNGDETEIITIENLRYYLENDCFIYNGNSPNGFDEFNSTSYYCNYYDDFPFSMGIYYYVYKINKKEHKEELEQIYSNKNITMVDEPIHFIWKINDWDSIKNEKLSDIYEIDDYKWRIKLVKDENNDKIGLYLKSINCVNTFCNIFTMYNLTLSNYKTYSYSLIKLLPSMVHYSKDNIQYGFDDFIKLSEIKKFDENGKSLLEDNQLIVSFYISIFELTKEFFISNVVNKYVESIKSSIQFYSNPTYLEFPIKDWDKFDNKEYEINFNYDNNKWDLLLYPKGCEKINNNYISIYLKNEDIYKDISNRTCVKMVLIMRNTNDYSFFNSYELPLKYLSKNINKYGVEKFVKIENAFSSITDIEQNISLIQENSTVIGVLLFNYKYNEKHYRKELKEILVNNYTTIENDDDLLEEKFIEFNIKDWSNAKDYEETKEYEIGQHKWKLSLYPNGNNEYKYMSFYLNSIDCNSENFPNDEKIYASYIFAIHSYYDNTLFHYKSSKFIKIFNKENPVRGFNQFIKKKYLKGDENEYDKDGKKTKSFINNNEVRVTAYIRVYKNNNLNNFFGYFNEFSNMKNERHAIKEDYFENIIKNFNYKLKKSYFTTDSCCSLDWAINLKLNEQNSPKTLSFYLTCLNFQNKNNTITSLKIKFILYIRNINTCNSFYSKVSPITVFNKKSHQYGYTNFIEIEELSKIYNEKPLLEAGEMIIGAYIIVYEINKFEDESTNLALVLKDYNKNKPNELNINKDELLRVIIPNIKEEWALVYKIHDRSKKGLVPRSYINIYDNNETEESLEQNKENENFTEECSELENDIPISIYCSNKEYYHQRCYYQKQKSNPLNVVLTSVIPIKEKIDVGLNIKPLEGVEEDIINESNGPNIVFTKDNSDASDNDGNEKNNKNDKAKESKD
ncbi:hypothetical protein BCR32DRAFT_294962 [Anaeromyces robustus]|uniref:MATH domain-containing protein n=1 Tax=Anaeromyces robustus TaxID=1754192 RepID=A0A1Y1WYS8_9FUNG|nr:hypothetical protein BCR32DRAFT_294962 [Anaeromyces robustus]|eukprot:ORX78582.1 hypothetical protein BCR32DRAFT_294962 [Anaeromyces robustus]